MTVGLPVWKKLSIIIDSGIRHSQTLDPALEYTTQTGLMLTDQDKADLIAYLKTLTDHEMVAGRTLFRSVS